MARSAVCFRRVLQAPSAAASPRTRRPEGSAGGTRVCIPNLAARWLRAPRHWDARNIDSEQGVVGSLRAGGALPLPPRRWAGCLDTLTGSLWRVACRRVPSSSEKTGATTSDGETKSAVHPMRANFGGPSVPICREMFGGSALQNIISKPGVGCMGGIPGRPSLARRCYPGGGWKRRGGTRVHPADPRRWLSRQVTTLPRQG